MSKVGSSLETDMTKVSQPPKSPKKPTEEQKEAIAKEEILSHSELYRLPGQVYEENGTPYDHYRQETER
jgi:hypothetical protein